MLNSLMSWLAGAASLVATVFAGLWSFQKIRIMKAEKQRLEEQYDNIARIGKRLEEARNAVKQQPPIDAQRRTDFETPP